MTKKTEYLPIGKLDDWWNSNLREETRIRIEAKLSSAKQNNAEWQPVLELGNARAQTCKITIAEAGNPFAKKGNEQIKKWFRGWAATLTAASLVTPVFDRIRFRELSRKQEHRRLRLFVDTNAIAQGAVQWLLSALGRRADILTSAVVDRELAAWPDREANFWRPTSIDSWKLRTHYRLARQITETPPADHLIDRLSPQQAALLLAKFRDEDSSAKKKSPDADVLLVEIARSLVRDQPRGARVLFLTGDRNCARTAVSALGSENVFYVACDDTRAEKAITDHKICIRGSWSPDG
ncbi:MAG TPA: hypothetical protein ENJ18_06480, partial [Nannocystis exedens]|nr:hypothetical protein [Nannocystis exedens]